MSKSSESKKFWRAQIKHRAVLALGGKCAVCGQVFEDCCYDFHHINPQNKIMTITHNNMNGAKSWLNIRDELKKCVVVCSNCHRLIHNGYITIEDKNYFNDNYYEWDLMQYNQINHNTLSPLDANYICPVCGQYKTAQAQLCQKCATAAQTKFNVTREALKELIRTTPFTKIGEMYGVSDNAIRKRCKSFNLPSTKKEIKQFTDDEWAKI